MATKTYIRHVSSTSCPGWPAPTNLSDSSFWWPRMTPASFLCDHLLELTLLGVSAELIPLFLLKHRLPLDSVYNTGLTVFLFHYKVFLSDLPAPPLLSNPLMDWVLSSHLFSHYSFCLGDLIYYIGLIPYTSMSPQLSTTHKATFLEVI